jgi:DNA-binding response OmpR family regulator
VTSQSGSVVPFCPMSHEKKPLGRILLEQRAVSPDQLDRALADKAGGGRLASRLTDQGILQDVEALKALSEQHGIPGIDLGQICLRLDDLDLLPREIAETHLILPVLVRDDRLFVAMGDPDDTKVLEELEFVTGKKVYPYVALDSVLRRLIQTAYAKRARGEQYHVGPRCPAETLERLGINPDGSLRRVFSDIPLEEQGREPSNTPNPSMRDGVPSLSPMLEQPVPRKTTALVVDDAMRLSSATEIEDQDFGKATCEDSVVQSPPLESDIEVSAPGIRTILIVDDDESIRKMVGRLLTKSGHRVIEADRGLTALRMVKEHSPDLIILDAMLPEVHGFDIARRIKKSKRYGETPIIMVSAVYRGWGFAEDLKQGFGVDAYIEKPFRIEELARVVSLCLSGNRFAVGSERVRGEHAAEAEAALNAGVEAYRAGRLEEAVTHLQKGLVIDPLAYRLHFHLGLLYGKTGQIFEAIGELEAAMELNSKHFVAAKNLAILYQKAGFRNKAVETWQRALTLAPDDETKKGIRDHLLDLL